MVDLLEIRQKKSISVHAERLFKCFCLSFDTFRQNGPFFALRVSLLFWSDDDAAVFSSTLNVIGFVASGLFKQLWSQNWK